MGLVKSKAHFTMITQEEIRFAVESDVGGVMRQIADHRHEIGHVYRHAVEASVARRCVLIHNSSGAFLRFRIIRGTTHVHEFIVPPAFRGRGIGASLLNRLSPPIELRCRVGIPSNDFYKKFGFEFVGKVPRKSGVWVQNLWRYYGTAVR